MSNVSFRKDEILNLAFGASFRNEVVEAHARSFRRMPRSTATCTSQVTNISTASKHPEMATEWRKLPLSLAELCIDTTLRCGQSFRWRHLNDQWHGVLRGRLLSLKQDTTHLHYKVTWPKSTLNPPTEDDTPSLLHNYFSLSQSLSTLYDQWTASDPNFAKKAPAFTGIRILNQDAWEALVAFICSSNNNISRISQMAHKLCLHYGPYVGTIEGEAFHDFPSPGALAGKEVEAHLRGLGFGYRAKYIADTARIVTTDRPTGWLDRLRNPDCPSMCANDDTGEDTTAKKEADPPTYRAAHEALLELSGVGPKVADCVCLMGLGWSEAIPVDTHVWQIAQRDYNFGKGGKTKTFSKAMYDAVGDHFRKIWGPQAGWAQSVLFTANLKSFAEQAATATGKVKTTVVKIETQESITTTVSRGKKRKASTVDVRAEITSGVVNAVSLKTECQLENKAVELEDKPGLLRRSKRVKTSK